MDILMFILSVDYFTKSFAFHDFKKLFFKMIDWRNCKISD